ncbi:MAG: hypothetical protein ACQCN6_13195 [Candidatus Bathyarchaeia archaeon]
MQTKMLLAPILAVTLALLLAAAFASLPEPSVSPVSTPMPSSHSTQVPAQTCAVAPTVSMFPVYIAMAVIVGLLAAFLFFREKSLNTD